MKKLDCEGGEDLGLRRRCKHDESAVEPAWHFLHSHSNFQCKKLCLFHISPSADVFNKLEPSAEICTELRTKHFSLRNTGSTHVQVLIVHVIVNEIIFPFQNSIDIIKQN
jgi:hypothetical protein